MKQIKFFLMLVLFTTLACGATVGCGSHTAKTESEKVQEASLENDSFNDNPVEITWWEYPNFNIKDKAEGEYELEMIDAFQEKNPGIKVRIEMIAFNSGPEKVNVAIATNSKPDLIFDYPGRIIGYGRQGVLIPLNDMFTGDIMNDIPSDILSVCSIGDKIYMYPTTTAPFLIGVNKTLFEKNGLLHLLPLDRPERNWTPDEFERALRAVKNEIRGVYPSVFYCKDPDGDSSTRFLIMNLFGTDLINKEQSKFVINSENGVKGLQWTIDKYKERLFAPNAETYLGSDAIDMFSKGKAATAIIYSPILQKIYSGKKTDTFEEVFLPWPSQPGQKPRIHVSVYGQCVFDNKDDLRAAAAKKFIDFLNNDQEWSKKNILTNGGFPVRASWAGIYDSTELRYAESMLKYSADSAVTVPYFSEIRLHWFPVLQDALMEKKTAKEALDKFVEEADKIVNKK